MGRPRLLDLCCSAGGAAKGYADAGFEVIGVDIRPQPRYPYEFHQADALTFPLDGFDVFHASPPCQGYSVTKSINPHAESYPRLVEPIRDRLKATGKPYVIENVPGSPLIDPLILCGSQFGLVTWWPGNGRVGLRRHRLFESNILIPDPGPHDHSLLSVPVYGHGPSGKKTPLKGIGHAQAERDVMGIDWMTREEINESIPPAYTYYIGAFLKESVGVLAA
jgi:DNA (cytosine-5)-methyltransferase 1